MLSNERLQQLGKGIYVLFLEAQQEALQVERDQYIDQPPVGLPGPAPKKRKPAKKKAGTPSPIPEGGDHTRFNILQWAVEHGGKVSNADLEANGWTKEEIYSRTGSLRNAKMLRLVHPGLSAVTAKGRAYLENTNTTASQ